jgi:pimeloyl-ACP methyl ester carboxylesterase
MGALGIERWNVYGESYGTTVVMMAALHPASIRSIVLDSVNPPHPGPLYSATVADAHDAFFMACASDPVCSQSYPDLAATYRDTLDQLSRNPLIVIIPPELRRPDNRVRLTAPLFEVLVGNLIYYPTYPQTPAKAGRLSEKRVLGASARARAISLVQRRRVSRA